MRTFNATDALSAATALVTAAPFTILMWAKTNDALDNFQVLGGFSEAGVDNFWKHRLRMVSGQIEFQAEQAAPPLDDEANTGAAVPSVNVFFTSAGLEIANNSRECYLDGANKGTNATTVDPANIDTTSIGQLDDGSPGDRFKGEIGHYAVYDAGLSQGMVETYAAGFNPLRIQRDNLIGYYPINGQDPEFNVMGGVDLSLVGTPPIAEEPPIRRFNVAPA